MDKELIAMCDCPEIQEAYCPPKMGEAHVWWDKRYKEIRKAIWDLESEAARCEFLNEFVFLPSVSWLLREIEVGENCRCELHKSADRRFFAAYVTWKVPCGEHDETVEYSSEFYDSPDKALLHVFMWQKGKVWKDGQWVRKEG